MHYTMGGESVTVDFANAMSSDIASDNLELAKDGDMRLCPLCNSEIRLFFINFNEKILMCENTECEFPFGHEELQFVKEHSDNESDEDDISSQKSRTNVSPSGTASTVSCNAWSEINHLNQIADVEEFTSEMRALDAKECVNDQDQNRKKREYAEKIRRHIEDIKELNEELTVDEAKEEVETQIRNEKWIRNLKNLQQISGVQLLKPEEMGLLKKEEPVIGLGELKIDINPGSSSNMSTIKIQIHNSCKDENNELEDKSSNPTGKDPLPV